jgi:hypothetical protein
MSLVRPKVLGRLERLDRDGKIVQKCLEWYNTMHPVICSSLLNFPAYQFSIAVRDYSFTALN